MGNLFWKFIFASGFLCHLRNFVLCVDVVEIDPGTSYVQPENMYKCPIGSDFTYACPSTKQPGRGLVCIHESWLCDQDPDCPEGEDEGTGEGMPCHNRHTDMCTKDEQFQCSDNPTLCIPINWMCDGDLDCDDGSDEAKPNCPHVKNLIPCTPNQLRCGGSHKCIPLSNVCDNKYDCDSGEDEFGCSNNKCEDVQCDKCAEVSVDGAKCYCDKGFYWNNSRNCTDLNECEYDQFCDQPSECTNTDGGYTCACISGYVLEGNSTCRAVNEPEGEEPTLLVSNQWDVRQLKISGKNLSPPFVRVGQSVTTLAFDHRKERVCWITYEGSKGKSLLQCSDVKSSTGQLHTIPAHTYLTTVESFAKDWIHGNWYFADPVLIRVTMCSADGIYCHALATKESKLVGPRSLVLDPLDGFLYFADWDETNHIIYKSALTGHGLTVFVSTKLIKPRGLSIDYANKHLYWADMDLNVLERIDLSGDANSRRVIAVGQKVEYIHSIAVFENYLYLSDRHENQLIRMHRYKYGEPVETLNGNLSRPGQLYVYHRQTQPDAIEEDPCQSAKCDHICAVHRQGGKLKGECLCAAGYTKSNNKCLVDASCSEFCTGTQCNGATDTHYPETCTLELCPPNTSYCSVLERCLPRAWWCDGKVDCPNGDDEGLYCKYKECLPIEFQCASGKCIDMSYRCDGNYDCGPDDKSDELNCNLTCNAENLFRCTENGACIMKVFVCDGHNDCTNGSDERQELCEQNPVFFPCNKDIEFQCRNGECIALSWQCDNDPDCGDGSDEIDCKSKIQCKDHEKACDNGRRCIPDHWFCDGEPDCIDRSDESDSNCPGANYTCLAPKRECEKDGIHVCLKPEQLCDQNKDCDDEHLDEGGMCEAKICQQEGQPCEDICYNTPDEPGFMCDCNTGEKLDADNKTCIPAVAADKLCDQWGICGQSCELDIQAEHGYRCTCFDGYFLEPDEFTCKPLESDPLYVIFSNRHELRRVDVATRNAVSLASGLRNTIALDFYYNDGLPILFWSDVMEDKIYRGTMTGNSLMNVEAIISSGLATTEGMAVDWVCENIYWVESSLDQIEVAKLDGSNRTTLIAGEMKSPRAIVVDPREGALFWTDWDGHDPRIEKCSMSGEGRKVIHRISPAEGGGWPNGLTVDFDFKRLYWIDARSESIHTVDYFGNNQRLILKSHKDMRHAFAITLFGNHVYWTDWSTNSVVRANKFNGSDVQIVQKSITQPFDLQVIHPKRQPAMANPCAVNNGGCSDLCLLGYNGSVGCRCPHRKRLDKDNKTCVEDMKFLLFVKNHEIRGVDIEKAHFNVLPVITIPHVDNPTAIDYDINSDTLYWADKGLNVIKKATFNAEVETLIDKGLKNTEGFAIDWLSRNMYFSSYDLTAQTASISVATLTGSFRTELISTKIVQPKSIALHPLKGYMFFTDVDGADGSHKIYRARMDGSAVTQLLTGLNKPTSLAVDFEDNKVFFINSGNKTIISFDFDGNNVKTIVNPNITNPEALTVNKGLLYVSTEEQIVSINKNGSGLFQLREATPNVHALLMFDKAARQKAGTVLNDCHLQKSRCSQLCLPSDAQMSHCKCTAGFDLDTDNASCVGIKSFLLYAKETEIRGQKFDALSTQEALPPISQIQSASAVDFLASEDSIFWVDTKANSISRIKRDLTQREVIVQDGISSVEGLAVDWIAKNIYWTDAGHSTIEVAKINGSSRYVITSGDMEKPRSIVVNPVLGYLYWSDWGLEARIERAKLDGSERVHYVYTNITMPWGLTIDYETHKLYWCDTANDMQTIAAIDLLTNQRHVLIRQTPDFQMNPISLTVYSDYIYWIDGKLSGSSIYRASRMDGSGQTLIRAELGGHLKDIKAFDSSRQRDSNLCAENNGGCSELCFYVGSHEVKCACSYSKLAADGKTCEDHKGFLMFSKVTRMESIHLDDENDKNPPIYTIKNDTFLRNVIGLSFDYEHQMIFYSDIQRGDIQSVFFNGTNIRVVVEGIGSAEGLAFEKFNGDIYWTSYTNSCISKINVNDALSNKTRKPEVVVQMSKHDHPRAIVVDSCWELIYWTNWNNEKPRIQRSNLTGEGAEDVIVTDILTPNGLTIDHKAKKLYWSDARLDKIETCDMDGSNRHVIITSIPQHSFGLAVYDNYLFWTDWMLRAVIRANKYDGTGIVWLRKNLERQPMGIIAVAEDSEDCTINNCFNNKHGCQDKCYTDVTGQAFCQCTYGRLKADGRSCASNFQCTGLGYEAYACLNGFCLPFQKSCDGVIDCVDGSDELRTTCKDRSCPPTMFSCSNRTQGQCIALSKKCDGIVDCMDGSDEALYVCGCRTDEFRCKSGVCIPKEYRCDGNGDCLDNSDEVGCDAIQCQEGYWKCKTGKTCIPENRKCDSHNDCGDKSDEANCTKTSCATNMFQCQSGECIYENWHCDRDFDCEDNSDEQGSHANCTYHCSNTQFMCRNDSSCISVNWVCDGNYDCQDRSDEANCKEWNSTTKQFVSKQNCTDSQFQCTSGRCIEKEWICDGEPDCRDGLDESKTANCDPVYCDDNEFQCQNYRCIEKEFFCDKDDDCGDGSDEPDTCEFYSTCSDFEFECKDGYCIDAYKHCDGTPDCADGSDEKLCPASLCGNTTMFFQCANRACIPMKLVCNGVNDCGDESDESPECYIDECKERRPCSQICNKKIIGFECSCNPGYQLRADKRTCEDIDECKTTYPCSHFCHNTIGSFYCECAEHYKLAGDKRHCSLTSEEGQAYLLVSNRYHIKKVNFDRTMESIVGNLTHSVAIDFDYKEQKLYWTDIHSQSSTINRISLNATEDSSEKAEVLHSSTVLNPDGMAVDWIGRNLYWCDRNTDTVEVSKLHGTYRKILIKDKSFLREPRALQLFPKYGYLFLSDWGEKPHISRISMDGKTKKHIITEEIAWPNALTIDYVTEKLFWADANYDYIAFSDLDGENRHVVISENLPHTFALTTFMDSIYWTDWETNGVFVAEKFSGEKRDIMVKMQHRPMDLVVYHALRQPEMKTNPCEALGCSHLCLLRPENGPNGERRDASAVCACPENHNLNEDKRTCTAACDNSQMLCVSTSRCIPQWWECDGHPDCEDGSDEPPECKDKPYYCRQTGLFQCANATSETDCIPPIGICDGTPQCADHSDETGWNNCADYPCILHQFKCKAENKCISDLKKCDGNKDCDDGEDEKDCAKQECLETQFRCNTTGNCIPYLWQCDGDNDCGDWFDEQSCTNRTCKDDYIKCEKTKKCIPKAWECDGEHDCGTGDDTDEDHDKCSDRTCDGTYFRCDNAHCIPGRWRCDDDRDCSDGSDEKECETRNCTDQEFKCKEGNRCIPLSLVCDGRHDCKDHSDELTTDCLSAVKCSATEFQCVAGSSCIPGSWKCDGEDDCLDGSDEQNCQSNCGQGEFTCKNGRCVSFLWRCDTENDCGDNSDEEECSSIACPIGRFRCGDDKCIPLHKKCNGRVDCSDGLDENICTISKCPYGTYKCNNNRTCLHPHQLCDGKPDCADDGDDDDADDEAAKICAKDKLQSCGILNGGCDQKCTYLSELHMTKCSCDPGYVLEDNNRRLCVEANPCADFGTCSQRCSYSRNDSQINCTCDITYKEAKDADNNTVCIPGGDSPILVFADEDKIYEQKVIDLYADDSTGRNISENASKIISLDVDVSSWNQVDWKMFIVKNMQLRKSIILRTFKQKDTKNSNDKKDSNSSGKRKRRETTVAKREETLITGLNDPQGIAVDWIGKNLYWTDASTSKIEMCQYNGTSCTRRKTVVKGDLADPFDIVVDPNYGKIFWTDRGYPPKIESANLDGSERRVLVSDFVIWPNGITLDYTNDRIYWADTKSHTVESVRLDGSDYQLVRTFDASDPPYQVDVFGDDLYVTTYKKREVLKFPKFYDKTVNSTETLTKSIMHIEDIVIIHASKQMIKLPKVTNACSSHPCPSPTQLCINNPQGNSVKYSCMCADGAIFNPTSKKCDFIECPQNYCNGKGNCTATQNNDFKCSCEIGYGGKRCEVDVCLHYCGGGGTCLVHSEKPSTPVCICPKGFSGERCQTFHCNEYCQNNGKCVYSIKNDNVTCSCGRGFSGKHCEIENPNVSDCDNFCLNGGTCQHNSSGIRICKCKENYTGRYCEKCGLQDSTETCENGGTVICHKNVDNSAPRCQCLPGYDPKTNCAKRTCDGYCENGALCTLRDNALACQCPLGYFGDRCENIAVNCTNVKCLNGGKCVLANQIGNAGGQGAQVQCSCQARYTGSRCEMYLGCDGFCKNGGNCSVGENGSMMCTCPVYYVGTRCETCNCGKNGECSTQKVNNVEQTYCKCIDKHFEGQFCNRSICHDWCYNGGQCIHCQLMENNIGQCEECVCKPQTSGPRCHIFLPRQKEKQSQHSILPIIVSVVVVLCILVAILLFIIIRKRRNVQFRHSRLKDHPNMQVSNPIYMPQTTEDLDDEEDQSHQPLDQPFDFDPEKSTNFANPVYEQFYADSRQTLLPKKDDSDDEASPSKKNGSV
ncbi:low-density lipoprotein receptor-related protein 1-like isoform X2 [Mercenaria mercenaria]|uniref:low-density lipoprotein receptor-related protein 1-like isoform X2 n=1 Tax=Mercenaria mercenaria TaxID=6596 RepID=UPI00234F61C1|nr:low-density lipoprotein receptor-related protein 1-like isoform X2 [Mercenaria mercenaria]